jgi:hypothetical protein
MANLPKLMRAIEALGIEELDKLREFIDWRRLELQNPHVPVHDDAEIGIDAVCAAIKQNRSGMSKEEIKEIKWTTSMLFLKDESKGYFE